MVMTEAYVEKKVVKRLLGQGYYEIKIALSNKSGNPDRFFGKNGFCFFVEFKKPGEEARPLQAMKAKLMLESGIKVFFVDDPNWDLPQKYKDVIDNCNVLSSIYTKK